MTNDHSHLLLCHLSHHISQANFDAWNEDYAYNHSTFGLVLNNEVVVLVGRFFVGIFLIFTDTVGKACHARTLIRMKSHFRFRCRLCTGSAVLARAACALVHVNITVSR